MIRHDFDWAAAPQPWCWIGPEFREKCDRIVRAEPPQRDPKITALRADCGRKGAYAAIAARLKARV